MLLSLPKEKGQTNIGNGFLLGYWDVVELRGREDIGAAILPGRLSPYLIPIGGEQKSRRLNGVLRDVGKESEPR